MKGNDRARFQHSSWALVTTVAGIFGQLGALSLIARFGSSRDLGHYGLALSVLMPAILLTGLGLRSVIAADVSARFDPNAALALRLTLTVTAVILISLVAWERGSPTSYVLALPLVGLLRVLDSVEDVCQGLLVREGRFQGMAAAAAARHAMALLGLWVGLHNFGLVVGLMLAAAASAGALIIGDLRLCASTGRISLPEVMRPSIAEMWQLIRIAYPLGVVVGLVALLSSIPRYALSISHGVEPVGIFTTLTSVASGGVVVVGAVYQPLLPRLAIMFRAGRITDFRRELFTALAGAFGLGLAGAVGALVIGPAVLDVLFGPTVARHAVEFFWLVALGALANGVVVLGTALTSTGLFGRQVLPLIVAAGATALFAYLLVPLHGLSGAVGASAIGVTVQLLSLGVAVRHICLPMDSRVASVRSSE